MTEQEKAKKLLPIIQAIAEGKRIQYSFNGVTWIDRDENLELQTICDDIISDSTDYRIKPEENYTIEQNTGENRVEGGVLSVSGSVSETHYCYECTRFQFCHIASGKTHKKACQKINLKREFEEKHYRPFKDFNELMSITGTKLLWVVDKCCSNEFLITGNQNLAVYIFDRWYSMKELFNEYTFPDGSPCGMLEE